jgi:hypothetical protein
MFLYKKNISDGKRGRWIMLRQGEQSLRSRQSPCLSWKLKVHCSVRRNSPWYWVLNFMNPDHIFTSSLMLFFYLCVFLSLGLFPFMLSANLFACISIPMLAVCPVIFIYDFFIMKHLVMQPKIVFRDTTSLHVRHILSDNVLTFWFQAYQMRGDGNREGDL